MVTRTRRPIARPELVVAIVRAGLQQQAVAALAGISEHTLTSLIRGRIDHPSTETMEAIAAVVGARPDQIFPEMFGEAVDPWDQSAAGHTATTTTAKK
jgi:transcriptional regulator with XRE-family HTH domain